MLGAVESFCLMPIIIAFHRFIILDEVAPGYVVDPGHPGFMAFFGTQFCGSWWFWHRKR
jgi:hypothetical protein